MNSSSAQTFSELPGKKMTCLFTGGGGVGNEAIYKILKDRYNLYFADSNVNRVHPIIPNSKKHFIPNATSSDFSTQVRKLVKKLECDLIIPGVDEELLILHNAFLDKPNILLLPDIMFIKKMLNKHECMKALQEKKINIPTTYLVEQFLTRAQYKFPYVLKPIRGRGSRDVYVINSINDLHSAIGRSKSRASDLLVQEFIEGREFTVSVISDRESNLKKIVPVLVHEKRGITIEAQIDCNPKVIRICKEFHETFKPAGNVNIQLKLDENDIPYIFEVNPRVSTTLCMAIYSGIDPIQAFLGEIDVGNFSEDVKLVRYWSNYLTKR